MPIVGKLDDRMDDYISKLTCLLEICNDVKTRKSPITKSCKEKGLSYKGVTRALSGVKLIEASNMAERRDEVNNDWALSPIENVYSFVFSCWDEHLAEYMPEDAKETLEYVLHDGDAFNEREIAILHSRFFEGKNLYEAGKEFNITRERVRQIEAKIIRKLRYPKRRQLLMFGLSQKELVDAEIDTIRDKMYQEYKDARIEEEKLKLELEFTPKKSTILLEDLGLSVRSYNSLKRYGCSTLGDVITLIENNEIEKVRNLGRKSLREIEDKIREYYSCK